MILMDRTGSLLPASHLDFLPKISEIAALSKHCVYCTQSSSQSAGTTTTTTTKLKFRFNLVHHDTSKPNPHFEKDRSKSNAASRSKLPIQTPEQISEISNKAKIINRLRSQQRGMLTNRYGSLDDGIVFRDEKHRSHIIRVFLVILTIASILFITSSIPHVSASPVHLTLAQRQEVTNWWPFEQQPGGAFGALAAPESSAPTEGAKDAAIGTSLGGLGQGADPLPQNTLNANIAPQPTDTVVETPSPIAPVSTAPVSVSEITISPSITPSSTALDSASASSQLVSIAPSSTEQLSSAIIPQSNITDAPQPTPESLAKKPVPFNPLYLIPLYVLLVCSFCAWIYTQTKACRNRDKDKPWKAATKPSSPDEEQAPIVEHIDPPGGMTSLISPVSPIETDCAEPLIKSFKADVTNDNPYKLNYQNHAAMTQTYGWRETVSRGGSSFLTSITRSKGKVIGESDGMPRSNRAWDDDQWKASRGIYSKLKGGKSEPIASKPPRIVVESPSSTLSNYTSSKSTVTPNWKRMLALKWRKHEKDETSATDTLAGKPYSAMGEAETGVKPRLISKMSDPLPPTIVERTGRSPKLDNFPSDEQRFIDMFTPPSVPVSIFTPGAYELGIQDSPTPSTISQYSTNTTLVGSYYYGSSSDRRPVTSPILYNIPGTVQPLAIIQEGRAELHPPVVGGVSKFLQDMDARMTRVNSKARRGPLNRNQTDATLLTISTDLSLTTPRPMSPVEQTGLRIVTESPWPPVYYSDSSSNNESPIVTPESPLSQCAEPLIQAERRESDDSAATAAYRVTPRGARPMLRQGPSSKTVILTSPTNELARQKTVYGVTSHSEPKTPERERDGSVRMPTGGRPSPSHVKRHSTSFITTSSMIATVGAPTPALSKESSPTRQIQRPKFQGRLSASNPIKLDSPSEFIQPSEILGARYPSPIDIARKPNTVGLGILGDGSPFERLERLNRPGQSPEVDVGDTFVDQRLKRLHRETNLNG